jgi:uncharacterized membrane protein
VLNVSKPADSLSESSNNAKSNVQKIALEPLEVNGITAVTVGTAIWLIAMVICLIQREQLEASGRGNWVWICACGVLLGLLGIRYTRRRAARIAKSSAS